MKKMLSALAIGLILSVVIGIFTGFERECEGIRESVLRLHILANSDDDCDQALKLAVRDAVLKEAGDLFYNVNSLSDAKLAATGNLKRIEQIANDEIKRNGFDYTAKAQVVNMFFNTRVYENFTLPAGRYDAVRITIGKAKGHNWWCVIYPALCLGAADEDNEIETVLTDKQADIVENPQSYRLRFKTVEIVEKIKDFFAGE